MHPARSPPSARGTVFLSPVINLDDNDFCDEEPLGLKVPLTNVVSDHSVDDWRHEAVSCTRGVASSACPSGNSCTSCPTAGGRDDTIVIDSDIEDYCGSSSNPLLPSRQPSSSSGSSRLRELLKSVNVCRSSALPGLAGILSVPSPNRVDRCTFDDKADEDDAPLSALVEACYSSHVEAASSTTGQASQVGATIINSSVSRERMARPSLDPFAHILTKLGVKHLHAWQRAVVEHWRAGGDTLVLSGTGSGKSICFQVPALVGSDSVVLVISPLISLMRDQVALMAKRNVAACFLGSAQSDASVEKRALAGGYSLVYLCPEGVHRLTKGFKKLYSRGRLKLIAIDEAHCISRWGHDFRSSYLKLGLLRQHFPGVPLMALTATATSRVREEICKSLCLSEPHICVNSFFRPNLTYSVRDSHCKEDCWKADLALVLRPDLRDGSGGASIVYVPSRQQTIKISAWLQKQGVSAAPYHAKLDRDYLRDVLYNFSNGLLGCVVATIAFGMGINKSNVRLVIHYGYPQSIEALHQETGRAGRDGRPADCILFADLSRKPQLLPSRKRDKETTKVCLDMLQDLHKYAIASRGCRVLTMLQYFGENKCSSWRCGSCDLCRKATPSAPPLDLGRDAAKLLSAVQQIENLRCAMGGGFESVQHVTHALVGNTTQGVRDVIGLEDLPCFGSGSNRSARFWEGLTRMFLPAGLLMSGARVQGRANADRCLEVTELGRSTLCLLERKVALPLLERLKLDSDVASEMRGATIAPNSRHAERQTSMGESMRLFTDGGGPGHRPRGARRSRLGALMGTIRRNSIRRISLSGEVVQRRRHQEAPNTNAKRRKLGVT